MSALFPRHRASSSVLRHFVPLATVVALFFACSDDSGRELLPGGAGAGGERSAGGAGGDGPDACGDGTRSADEACDDGNVDSGDGCDRRCRVEPGSSACGDGVVGTREECDDGNVELGDGCDDRCREERCGNRRLDAGEECDPPAGEMCSTSCLHASPHCGDGEIQEDEGEQCDDRNENANDGCHECRRQCGNGRIDRDRGEECDPSLSTTAHCSDQCKWLPVCGDGVVQESEDEECDPSNGTTCVDCHRRDPEPPCGAGGAPSSGCGGSGGAGECAPLGSSELIQNGGFDTGYVGWTPHASGITLRSVDDGAPAPKALEVNFSQGPVRAVSGAYQCIPVRPGRTYELTANYKIATGAPEGVAATVTALVYSGTRCEGTFLAPAGSGPQGTVRNAWTPYQARLTTSALPESAGEGRMLVRLGVVRPANVQGSSVHWDSASLRDDGAMCGNCVVDRGETCDDGNQTSGDGCGPTCRLETCGDGVREGAEQCDDGDAVFAQGDTCTPSCRAPSECHTCSASACSAEVEACLGLTGVARGGRREGTALSTLCDELRTCVYESACHLVTRKTEGVEGAFLENCYCGTSGENCFDMPRAANGSCRAEVEAALETTNPSTIMSRMSGSVAEYPVFAALRGLLACEDSAVCASACVPTPACGDGLVQDRNLDFEFVIDGEEVACSDEYTATGRGCSFEECDDGNDAPGDGCDAHCFVEACGNYVVQTGETCDDGNREDGDGCDSDCKREFVCGDGMVKAPFEECDPPGGTRVCTLAEEMSNGAQCACDNNCTHVVCGDETVQRPFEECDPPNPGVCEPDCTFSDQGPCEACINMNEDLRAFNELYCSIDAACTRLKQCLITAQCQFPNGSDCYCGKDVPASECRVPGFVPMGPCREEIRDGSGEGTLDNSTVLDRMTNYSYPSGAAIQLLDEASRACPDACPHP
jgi:cysteine-rich repeat protein